MTISSITDLHQFIVAHYSNEELKTLCFNLFVEYEDLSGEGRSGKARELVKYVERHGRLDHLQAALAEEHPQAYQAQFRDTPIAPAVPVRPKRNARQVFISHAHQDAAFAQKLAADLRAQGFPVWIAPDSIQIGEEWPDAISRGLEESGVVIVALTPQALLSEWVRKETNAAIILEAKKRIRFAPLDVADCEPPVLWSTYHYVPFRTSYETGLDALLGWLDGRPAPPVETGRRPVSTPPTTVTPNRRIHAKTGIELIRIPAGPFLYGSADSDELAFGDEKPQRTIDLPDYWIGRTPVTNAQYKRFLDANPRHRVPYAEESWAKPYNWDQTRRAYPEGKAEHPVVLVSWDDAQAFCDWARLQLPSEQAWEKAARGTDGRVWPWGDEPPTADHCNFNNNVGGTTPVDRYSPRGDSPYGCVDMAGNVLEWTASWYREGETRAVRGGSWLSSTQSSRAAYRLDYNPDDRDYLIGFRVAEHLSDPES
jgi:formylglycine-generating enzyme required for sulfatase activity